MILLLGLLLALLLLCGTRRSAWTRAWHVAQQHGTWRNGLHATNHCWQAVREDVHRSALTVVITWSPEGRGSNTGSEALKTIARAFSLLGSVRALIDAKGASCSALP